MALFPMVTGGGSQFNYIIAYGGYWYNSTEWDGTYSRSCSTAGGGIYNNGLFTAIYHLGNNGFYDPTLPWSTDKFTIEPTKNIAKPSITITAKVDCTVSLLHKGTTVTLTANQTYQDDLGNSQGVYGGIYSST